MDLNNHAEGGGHEENNERWLVSYADYVTLLFAFFVVMFASSNANKQKAQQLSESVRRAYGTKTEADVHWPAATAAPPAGAQDSGREEAEPFDLKPSLDTLMRELEREIKSGKVVLRMETRGLVISLQETAFFQPGDDVITPSMAPAIFTIAKALEKLPNAIRLEGHTDSTPIHNSRFRSNWQLSCARALATLEFLAMRCNLPTERMSVAGYSDTMPVDSNDTPAGRSRNRRVDVVVASYPARRKPQAASPPPTPGSHARAAGQTPAESETGPAAKRG
jgi:chemotaxis protein MotB